MSTLRTYRLRIVVLLAVALAVGGVYRYTLHVLQVNQQRRGSGVAEQVIAFRIRLWAYHVSHQRGPRSLAEIVPSAGRRDAIRFTTLQGMTCRLEFNPRARRGAAAFHITCGDPLYASFELGGDGTMLRERWESGWWLGLPSLRRKAQYPMLTDLLMAGGRRPH